MQWKPGTFWGCGLQAAILSMYALKSTPFVNCAISLPTLSLSLCCWDNVAVKATNRNPIQSLGKFIEKKILLCQCFFHGSMKHMGSQKKHLSQYAALQCRNWHFFQFLKALLRANERYEVQATADMLSLSNHSAGLGKRKNKKQKTNEKSPKALKCQSQKSL